jgi:hypothetical protein
MFRLKQKQLGEEKFEDNKELIRSRIYKDKTIQWSKETGQKRKQQ